MGGQILDVVRQGIWPSLTGGWFVDPSLSNFCNTFHLYTWLALLLIPFVLSLVVTPAAQLPAWAAYCFFVGIAFTVLKVVNYRLHLLFDTSEAIDATGEDAPNQTDNPAGDQEPETFELTERHPPAPVAASLDEVSQAAADSLPLASHAVDLGDKAAAAEAPPCTGHVSSAVDSPAFTSVSGAVAAALTTSVAEQRLPSLPLGLSADNRRLTSSNSSSTESAAVIVHRVASQSQTVHSSRPSESVEAVGHSTCTLPTVATNRTDIGAVGILSAGIEAVSLPAAIGSHTGRRWLDSPTFMRGSDSRGVGAPLYSSHHLIRRRNAVRRRTKSAHDSPRMLVSECRLSEDPRVRLEWSGSPHPSPRPRQRILSLHGAGDSGVAAASSVGRGPTAGSSGRRSSWELHARRPLPVLRHHHSDKGERFALAVEAASVVAGPRNASVGYSSALAACADRSGTGDSGSGDLADGHDRDFLDRVKANKTLAEASVLGFPPSNAGSGWRPPGRARARPGSSSPRCSRRATVTGATEAGDDSECLTPASSTSDVFVVSAVGRGHERDDFNNSSSNGIADGDGSGSCRDGFPSQNEMRFATSSCSAASAVPTEVADAVQKQNALYRRLCESERTVRQAGAATAGNAPKESGAAAADVALWLMDSMESFDCRIARQSATDDRRFGKGSGLVPVGDDSSGVTVLQQHEPDFAITSLAMGDANGSDAADQALSSANPSPSSNSSANEASALLSCSDSRKERRRRTTSGSALRAAACALPGRRPDSPTPAPQQRQSPPLPPRLQSRLSDRGELGGAQRTRRRRGIEMSSVAADAASDNILPAVANVSMSASLGTDPPFPDAVDEGKLHFFQDEEGYWWVYSFGPNAEPRRLSSGFHPADFDDDIGPAVVGSGSGDDKDESSSSDSDIEPAKQPAVHQRSPPPPPSPKPPMNRQRLAAGTSQVASLTDAQTLALNNEIFARLSLIDRDGSLMDSLVGRDSSGELLTRLHQVMARSLQQQQQIMQREGYRGDPQNYNMWVQPRRIREPRGGDLASPGAMTLSSSSSGSLSTSPSSSRVAVHEAAAQAADGRRRRRHHYYKWKLLPKLSVRIWLDRLSLLSLMDRNVSIWENVASVSLAVLVAILASALLAQGFYHDIWILIFCAVAAGCQYSLLKSVQPDAASPMHGYNRVIVFSRAFYFCMCAGLILGLHTAAGTWAMNQEQQQQQHSIALYGIPLVSKDTLIFARDALTVFILCLPIVFTMGLLPQFTTFVQFVCEQLDIHVFGGSGTSSPLTALYALFQSCVSAGILYAFCFIPVQLTYAQEDGSRWPAKSSKHVMFSVYCGIYVAMSYVTSRMPSDPTHLRTLLLHWYNRSRKTSRAENPTALSLASQSAAGQISGSEGKTLTIAAGADSSLEDPLPGQLLALTSERIRANVIVSLFIAVFAFGIHVSTVFSALQPTLHYVLCVCTVSLGFMLHYVGPQLRKEYPWLCCAHPLLETHERQLFEVRDAARITRFEKAYLWLCFIEKNIAYPALMLSALTISVEPTLLLFGKIVGPLLLAVCGLKVLRSAYCNASHHYVVVAFTTLLFAFDWQNAAEQQLVVLNYAVFLVLYHKIYDFYTKVQFVLVYIAPWQLAWGSAVHAFAQPLSVPHSVMTFSQAALSAIISAPLNPFLGSAIFITSYCRPVKFWEKDYNTKRVDHSNVRLASHLDHDLGTDDNNLNSVFYEHLTRTLQKVLCGDLMMGRWGRVSEGDMFIMASDYLNALVHIVEMGNGLVTFQLRGLEFRGTYCQQREVDAITEGVEEDHGFCCCHPGHLPHFLSFNATFGQRWLAWQVAAAKYVLEGYSISDNNAASMLQVYDLRFVLMVYYVKSTIYNIVQSPLLVRWLADDDGGGISSGLAAYSDDSFVDLDRSFSILIDADYDSRACGITRESFCRVYLPWIKHCAAKRAAASGSDDVALQALLNVEDRRSSPLVLLCFGMSLLARRALATASRNNYSSASVDFLLFGLHALFKGDIRVTSSRDEWVLKDVELLQKVVAPAVRMALKLHQDHFTSSEEYDDNQTLYEAIAAYEKNLVISHETDPVWRSAILAGRPSLLALRHMFDEGSDSYKIIMLNKRYLSFRIIKVNRECVRGMWAGQQQELIFLRNRNTERGSIQNAKQVLRNMINSSCDQPIGYPIYVSPLTTSYAGSSEQLCSVIGREMPLRITRHSLREAWAALRRRCGNSGGGDPAAGSRRRMGLGSRAAASDSIEMGMLSHGGRIGAPPAVQLTSVSPLATLSVGAAAPATLGALGSTAATAVAGPSSAPTAISDTAGAFPVRLTAATASPPRRAPSVSDVLPSRGGTIEGRSKGPETLRH